MNRRSFLGALGLAPAVVAAGAQARAPATGGIVKSAGASFVGERGPESVTISVKIDGATHQAMVREAVMRARAEFGRNMQDYVERRG
jgi:hypothetical protein